MQQVRAIFKFAYDNDLIDRPVRFGTAFNGPSAKNQQKDKVAKKEARILTAEQIRGLVAGARVTLKAMILLGINCGFGNNDCETLTFQALDLEASLAQPPQAENGGVRDGRKLWPETVERYARPLPYATSQTTDANADRVFIGIHGEPVGQGGSTPRRCVQNRLGQTRLPPLPGPSSRS